MTAAVAAGLDKALDDLNCPVVALPSLIGFNVLLLFDLSLDLTKEPIS